MRPSVLITRAFFLINFHIFLCFFFVVFLQFNILSLGFWLKTLYVLYSPCDIISTWQLAPVSFIVYMFITWVRRTAKTIFKSNRGKTSFVHWWSRVVSGVCLCVFFPHSTIAPPCSHFCHGCHGDIYAFHASPTHCRHICLASVTRPHNERRFSV